MSVAKAFFFFFFLLNAVGRHEFKREANASAVAAVVGSLIYSPWLVYCTNATNPHGPSVASCVLCPFVAQWQDNDPF